MSFGIGTLLHDNRLTLSLWPRHAIRMQILCTLASADEGKAAWLHSAGVLRLLERLTLLRAELDAEPGALDSPAEGLSLRVRKQVRPLW